MSQSPCEICKGACCESLVFPSSSYKPLKEFLAVRGVETDHQPGFYEVESKCPKLNSCGRCSIHATRPEICRTFEVGGDQCLATVNRRRHGYHREAILFAIREMKQ